MPLGIIILAVVVMVIGGILNIRSLIRKWKANPDKWFHLLVGVVITLAAIGLVTWQLFKNHLL